MMLHSDVILNATYDQNNLQIYPLWAKRVLSYYILNTPPIGIRVKELDGFLKDWFPKPENSEST